jgi:hypothetical protein
VGRLTSGRRCSRRRLDEEGGASSVFTAASCFLLCPGFPSDADGSFLSRGDWSGSSRSQAFSSSGVSAATRRPTRSSPPPLPCPLAAALTRERENPNTGWWEATATPGSPYGVSVKAVRG